MYEVALSLQQTVFNIGQVASNLVHPEFIRPHRDAGNVNAARG
jgi:hypothetical protein